MRRSWHVADALVARRDTRAPRSISPIILRRRRRGSDECLVARAVACRLRSGKTNAIVREMRGFRTEQLCHKLDRATFP